MTKNRRRHYRTFPDSTGTPIHPGDYVFRPGDLDPALVISLWHDSMDDTDVSIRADGKIRRYSSKDLTLVPAKGELQ